MKSKLDELQIISGDPFRNCKLERQRYAEILKQIVSIYDEGCVLTVNGKWGTGKTTFVKMWKQLLDDDQFKTIYFNAWESDFALDPIAALIGNFKILGGDSGNVDKLIQSASKFATKIIPSIIDTVISKYTGQEMSSIIKKITEFSESFLSQEIEEYEERCKSFDNFKKNLSNYITENCAGKPLIFIVDELDRCNPSYAVKVLERIKHLFSVPNLVFVLSIDKYQLGNSIRGYYGSDRIDADEYLRRFIDIEYELPEPNVKDFCSYLYEVYNFSPFFIERKKLHNCESEELINITYKLSRSSKLSLRQIEKMFSYTRLVLRSFNTIQDFSPDLLILLIYLRMYKVDFYRRICSQEDNIQILVEQIEIVLPESLFKEDDNKIFYYTIAELLNHYVIKDNTQTEELVIDGNDKLTFKTSKIDSNTLLEAIINDRKFTKHRSSLLYLTKKIDLLDNFYS